MRETRVLGVRVDCVDMAGALERIAALIDAGGTHLVATVNPEFVMSARRDPEFARVLESSDLCLADGSRVVWAARRNGCGLDAPVPGVDLIPELAAMCVRLKRGMFLLGAAPGVADEAARRLKAANPGLAVAAHSGSPDPENDDETLSLIAAQHPAVLLVAFGAPKQEKWIDRMRGRLGVPVCVGVGGAFDYLAGVVPRAPALMRRVGLEWLFRLVMQPWRVGRMSVLPIFALRVLLSKKDETSRP